MRNGRRAHEHPAHRSRTEDIVTGIELLSKQKIKAAKLLVILFQ
jgi:hypothetical protein